MVVEEQEVKLNEHVRAHEATLGACVHVQRASSQIRQAPDRRVESQENQAGNVDPRN